MSPKQVGHVDRLYQVINSFTHLQQHDQGDGISSRVVACNDDDRSCKDQIANAGHAQADAINASVGDKLLQHHPVNRFCLLLHDRTLFVECSDYRDPSDALIQERNDRRLEN